MLHQSWIILIRKNDQTKYHNLILLYLLLILFIYHVSYKLNNIMSVFIYTVRYNRHYSSLCVCAWCVLTESSPEKHTIQ